LVFCLMPNQLAYAVFGHNTKLYTAVFIPLILISST
jgi:hypothetical protein